MLSQPCVQPRQTAPARSGRPQRGRGLAFCLLFSLVLHGVGVSLWSPAGWLVPPDVATPSAGALRLMLAKRVEPAAGPAASGPPMTARARTRVRPAARARGAPSTAPASVDAPGPAPAETGLPLAATDAGPALPASIGLMAAARREAAATARALNRAPGAERQFRSSAQAELDRQFDAAHAAGGSWFRSARIEEITRASDGNARVYRIVTPFGAFCRSYPANGGQPMNMLCPR